MHGQKNDTSNEGTEGGASCISAYFEKVGERLAWVMTTQAEAMQQAAVKIADSLQQGGMWYIFGTGHSHMLAEEAFYRAGGLLGVAPILEGSLMLHESAMQSSELERTSGIAQVIVNKRDLQPHDVLLIASNSGRNAVPVEMAEAAKGRGVFTIALTSMAHSQRVSSRAPSGKRLFETADLVIDNGAPYGDAMMAVGDGVPLMGPLSTVTGAAIINALSVQVAAMLIARGEPVHVWTSANVDDADGRADRERYEQAVAQVQQRVRHL